MSTNKMQRKSRKMRKKWRKVNKFRILMKNLIYSKNVLVSKEAFSRENSQMGFRTFLLCRVRKLKSRGIKILAIDFFF